MHNTLLVCLVLVHWRLSCSPKESRRESVPGLSVQHAPIWTAFSRMWLPGSKRVNSSVFTSPGLIHAVSRWCLFLGSFGDILEVKVAERIILGSSLILFENSFRGS